jgi:hypothetical protein
MVPNPTSGRGPGDSSVKSPVPLEASDQGPPCEELCAVELRGNAFESEYGAIHARRMRALLPRSRRK